MNSTGNGALSKAMTDSDESVRIAAIKAAGRVNTFTDEQTAATLTGDVSPYVRRLGVQLLADLRATDTVASVMTLAQSDVDANVRIAACAALGVFGNPTAQATLQGIVQKDANSFVRDAATIALLQL
jgi:HEAT repeat protein